MKKILTGTMGTFLLLSLFSLSSLAQKKLTEGTVLYDITISSNSDKPQMAELFNGAVNTVYIKPGKSRTEMVSSLGTTTTVINQTATQKEITILKEYGEQKYMINLTPADWVDVNKKYDGVTFSYDNSSTKTIQGFLAKKAIGSLGDSTTFTVWYTPDIIVDSKDFQYVNRSLPGLALEYETTIGNLKVTYTASKVSFAPVPASKFELPKSGFRVMTYQESKGKGTKN
jgi:GLPGLI family protein